MKKTIGILAVAALALPLAAFAAQFKVGEQTGIGPSERIQNDVYLAGGNVTSAGTVVGDIIAAGGTVIVSGPVSDDVIAAGGTVNILSNVGDDIRALGGTIVVNGPVAGDVIAAGGQISVDGSVGGDVALAGGTVRLDAPVSGDVRIGGGNIYLNAPINGSVVIDAETLTLGSGAVIRGTLTYTAHKELVKEEGATISGEVQFTQREKRTEHSKNGLAALASVVLLGKFLALFVGALIISLSFKRYSADLIFQAAEHPLYELGRGLVALAVIPVVSILLCITLIGLPLGILGFLSYAAVLLFAWLAAPIVVGSIAYRYVRKDADALSWKTVLTGSIIMTLLGLVPFIGWITCCLIFFWTLGTIAGMKLRIAQEWR